MGFGGRVSGLGLMVFLLTGPAWAQEPGAVANPAGAAAAADPSDVSALPATAEPPGVPTPLPPSVPGDALSPDRLMAGPSLRETGRVAVSPTMPTSAIETEDTPKSPNEKSIQRAASSLATAAPMRPHGVIDPRILDREVTDHFTQIAGCRVEVARAKQVKPPDVIADQLLLRWTIEPDGSTAATDVVAIAPVDLGVMDCAKRVMSQWRFTRPRGGPLNVERRFTFAAAVPGER
jgi:hypothetical protein